MGLPSKTGNNPKICLKTDDKVTFEPKENANIFKNFYANLANDLVKELPHPCGKFGKTYVQRYYKDHQILPISFTFTAVKEEFISDLLGNMKTNKAAGIDGISGRFFKDGASVLTKPITELMNLSILLSKVPENTKIAKLKPLFKKGQN